MYPKNQDDWCDKLYEDGLEAAKHVDLQPLGFIVGRAFCFAIAGGAYDPKQVRRLDDFFIALLALLDGAAWRTWETEEQLYGALRHLVLEMRDEALAVAEGELAPKN